MKTLDEVIAYFDNQTQQRHVYLTEDAEDIYNDALHYLKEYQILQTAYIKAMADLEDNPPLTWSELKQMEGKPVWVEDHNDDDEPYNRWYIVERFIKEQGDEYAVLNDYYFSRKYFNDRTDGWQAYRKEKE